MLKKVFVTTSLSILFLAFIAYNGWSLFKLNSGLKKVLVTKLQTAIGESCDIERLRLGLGSINLGGVNLAFEGSPYEVWIDELRLGYSLKSLLKGKGSLEKTAEEVTLYRPVLMISHNPGQEKPAGRNLSFELSRGTQEIYQAIIKEYDFIKKITISEGEIVLANSLTDEKTKIAKKVNGWAYADHDQQVWLRMAGHVFESDEYNMVLYGQFDIARGGLDFINVDLHDYKIGDEIPFVVPDYLDVQDGLVNGHLVITERYEPTRGFNIEGDVSLEGGRLKFASENLYIEDIAIAAEVKDWNLKIKEASQTINGARTRLHGTVANLLQPVLDLTLVSDKFDVESFLKRILPREALHLQGTTQCSVYISEALKTPKVVGSLQSDSLLFHQQTISNVQIDLLFSESKLGFDNVTGYLNGFFITGHGNIDLSKRDRWLDFRFDIEGDYTRHLHKWGLPTSDECFVESEIAILGPAKRPVSRGEFAVRFSRDEIKTLALNGSFNYSDGDVSLTAASENEKFHLAATANNLFHKPRLSVEANNLGQVLSFANNSKLDFIRDRYNLNLYAEGSRENLYVALDGHRRDNYEKIFRIETDTTASSLTDHIRGEIALFPNSQHSLQGDFELRIGAQDLSLERIYLGDWLQGRMDFSRETLTPRSGRVTVKSLYLAQVLSLLGSGPSHYDGNLYGEVNIEPGTEGSQFVGNLWLLDGMFRNVGPIKGELSFLADAEKLVFNKLAFENAGQASVRATGVYTFDNHEVEATIEGSGVRIENVIKIVTGKSDLVYGQADLDIGVKGQLSHASLTGSVRVKKPRILMFDFDEAVFDLGTRKDPNGSYFSADELVVGHAILHRNEVFRVEGPARLPLTSLSSLDVNLSGSGNFLSLLPNLADVFLSDSQSKGHLTLRLSGEYTRPNFAGSRLKLSEGRLALTSVIDKIENLQADLEVQEEDYFLDIKQLVGRIRKAPFSISNAKAMPNLPGLQLDPLRIAGDDLNLGILTLTSPKNGVSLHIPALMEPGEYGIYKFRGKASGEPFLIAGPWERPYVRGEVVVRSANLVFPFYEGEGEENPIVRNILNNIDWDLRTISDKDTRYVKQFSTAVYVNMVVDPNNSLLDFSGVLKDSTFRIEGKVESTRGEFEYIDLNFRVDKFGAEFTKNSLYPMTYGKAYTVVRDSSNVPSDVYLTLYTVDDLNQEVSKGRWDRINIKLSSEYGGYEETQGQLMASLGYTSENVEDQARKAVGYSTDKFLFRPLFRPVERQLERSLGLDVVRFSYAITRNFLDASFNNEQLSSSLALLRSSRLILGKYLTDDVYLLYTGELKAGIDYQFQNKGVGLQHVVGLEYRLNSQWLFQMEYDYNTLLNVQKDDKKLWLRHSFPF